MKPVRIAFLNSLFQIYSISLFHFSPSSSLHTTLSPFHHAPLFFLLTLVIYLFFLSLLGDPGALFMFFNTSLTYITVTTSFIASTADSLINPSTLFTYNGNILGLLIVQYCYCFIVQFCECRYGL